MTLLFIAAGAGAIAAVGQGCREDHDGSAADRNRTAHVPDQPPEHDAPPRQPVN